jgi:hypothetical protein
LQELCHQHNPLKKRVLFFVHVGPRWPVLVGNGHNMGTGTSRFLTGRGFLPRPFLFFGVQSLRPGYQKKVMAKEPTLVSGAALVAALERVCAIMKEEVGKDPELAYHAAAGGLKSLPSLAVVITFDPKTLKPKTTTICSEKRAAKEWNKAHANGIKI